MINMTRFKSS